MIYTIVLPPGVEVPEDVELDYDNAVPVQQCLKYLRRKFGDLDFQVERDGKRIDRATLEADERSDKIRNVMEEEIALPGTFRPGWGGASDLGSTADGARHGVWKPPNPEDNFE